MFPGFDNNRKTMRAPVNPLDKATIISIYPKPFYSEKPTMQPGRFNIPAGSYDKPSVYVVGPSSWWREIDVNQPLLEIPTSSILMAESIVTDYCNGILGCDMGDAMPGLFTLPGEFTVDKVKKDHQNLLNRARDRQINWFKELIKIADVSWARTNGNPLAVDNSMRLAAQELGLKEKAWLQDFNTLELKNCPACGFLRNNSFPVCANCKTILDKEKFEKLGLKLTA